MWSSTDFDLMIWSAAFLNLRCLRNVSMSTTLRTDLRRLYDSEVKGQRHRKTALTRRQMFLEQIPTYDAFRSHELVRQRGRAFNR